MTTDLPEINHLESPELELAYTQETKAAIESLFQETFKDTDSFYAPSTETLTKEEAKNVALNVGFITISGNNDINHSLGPRLNNDGTLQCCHKWWRRGNLGATTSVHM